MNKYVRTPRIEATYSKDENSGYVEGRVVEVSIHYLKDVSYMRLHLENSEGKESFAVSLGYLYRDDGKRNGLLGSWVKLRNRLGNITWDIAKVEVNDTP